MQKSFHDYIQEDLQHTGNKKLKTSSIHDKHIQNTIDFLAKNTGANREDIENNFKSQIESRKKSLSFSDINKNAIENAAESVAFDSLDHINMDNIDLSDYGLEKKDLLDRSVFFDLTERVLNENAEFFPLKNPFEIKAVKPYFYITPDHLPLMTDASLKTAAEHSCKTAFCTPEAQMVFSRPFTEKLALSAILNEVKPKSKKYVSNGGPIPDHYAYLEFVIMHELLHFSAGDHFYTKSMTEKIKKKHPKIAKRAGDVLNYVGDYINNWTLAQSGYEQLPIGLFSEDINYDNYESYEDIIDAVVKSIQNIPEQEYKNMSNTMQNSMDDHMDNENDKPSQGGKDSKPETKKGAQEQERAKTPEVDDKSQSSTQTTSSQPLDGDDNSDTSDMPNREEDPKTKGPEAGNTGSDGNGNDNAGGYKVGDIVKINSSGQKAKIIYASEPDADGRQQIEVEEISEISESKFINEAITLTSDDISPWQEPDDGQGDDNQTSDDGQGDDNQTSENGSDNADDIAKAIDDAMKKNKNKVNKRDDGTDDPTKREQRESSVTGDQQAKGADDIPDGSTTIEFKAASNTINWEKLLKRMIPRDEGKQEETYLKMSKETTSSMVTAIQTGMGRIKPGEILVDSDKRGIVFVIDNSASVLSRLNEFNQQIMHLLKKNSKYLSNMYIVTFSSDYEVYRVDIKKMKYSHVLNKHTLNSKKPKLKFAPPMKLQALFTQPAGLGTEYSPQLHKVVEYFHDKLKLNVIMFTDDDLVGSDTFPKFIRMIKRRRNSGCIIYTSQDDYDKMTKKFGDSKATVLK